MKTFFIFIFCLSALLSGAQIVETVKTSEDGGHVKNMLLNLTGKVTDSISGEALQGASIYFAEARIGAVSGADGFYQVRNIPTGHYLVEVSHAGYTTLVVHLDITAETVKNFALSPSIIENQGVTVTGVTSATSIRNAPIAVTLLRRAQLMQVPSTNIIDALSHQPGVAQISTGPAISKPVIRGLGYNRVVVVNDGVRQEGQQWGDEHGIEIDEMSVQRAEILKGPASITYGSDALAGVVNFITNVPVAEGTVKGNVYTSYQTNNKQYGLNANIAGNNKGFSWNAYGSYKSAGSYQNKWDGRVLNSGFNERNFGGYAGINKGWGYSHIIVSSFNQNIGLVEAERDAATGKFLLYAGSALERIATKEDLESRRLFVPNQNVQHYKIITDNSFVLGKSRLKVNVGYQNNLRKEFGDPENPEEEELFFDLKTTSYNVQLALPERKDWHTTLGFSGMAQGNQNKGAEVIIPEYLFFDAGGFVFTQKGFEKVNFSGGLRYDHRSVHSKQLMDGVDEKFAAFTKSFSNISGTAGISYQPSKTATIKANIAKGFRAPTLSELASNGAHEGTSRYEYGQQNLTSEKSWQSDLGVQLDYTHVSFSVNGYYNRINNFIFYRRLSNAAGTDSIININNQDLEAFQYSQQNAALAGFEATIDLHPHPLDWLHFENSFSLVRGKFDERLDGSNNLPMIPAPKLQSELRVNFKKTGAYLKNFYVLAELDKTFAQNHPFTGYNTETATPGYTLLNAGIGTDLTLKGNTLFSLHIAANNITDVAYQNHLSRLKYTAINNATGRQGVFNTGRNFSLKLNVPLTFAAH